MERFVLLGRIPPKNLGFEMDAITGPSLQRHDAALTELFRAIANFCCSGDHCMGVKQVHFIINTKKIADL